MRAYDFSENIPHSHFPINQTDPYKAKTQATHQTNQTIDPEIPISRTEDEGGVESEHQFPAQLFRNIPRGPL
jgi:hypothetical protein